MSYVDTFAPHLPYLRRFARAITGSQSSGDAYVHSALSALATGDVTVDEALRPKIALFQIFLTIWNVTGATLEDDIKDSALDGSDKLSPEARVHRLTPRSRQAFLLNALESLKANEVAQVMQIEELEARALIKEAEADIEKELRTNVLIIEDEPFIAADIEGLVTDLGHTVDDIVATRTEAVKAAMDVKPGLILADVQLADGSNGIDAVTDILQEYDVPVIFITAFPERLLTGNKPEPAYLISKPFRSENVKAAISQALFFNT